MNYQLNVPFIGICGPAGSGKTTLQEILRDELGLLLVDDKDHLRKSVCEMYGLTDWHVHSQKGKASKLVIGGREWTVREILGEFGNRLEEMHGENVLAETCMMNLRKKHGSNIPQCSFGSVRRNQGEIYRREGGIILLNDNGTPNSGFEFDSYNPELVDVVFKGKRYDVFDDAARKETAENLLSHLSPYLSKRAA